MDLVLPPDASSETHLIVEISAFAHRYARALMSAAAAEDLAQDVVLECLIRIRDGRWRIKHSLAAFVRAMVRRRRADTLRLRERRAAREAQHANECADGVHAWMSPELVLESEELDAFHVRMLAQLPPGCRNAYTMVREEETSYQVAAEKLGVTRAAVCAHIVTAHRRFRAGLADEDIAVPLGKPAKRD